MKHKVYIREINFGITEVEADTPEQAEKFAEDSFFNDEIQWESVKLDCSVTPFEDGGYDE